MNVGFNAKKPIAAATATLSNVIMVAVSPLLTRLDSPPGLRVLKDYLFAPQLQSAFATLGVVVGLSTAKDRAIAARTLRSVNIVSVSLGAKQPRISFDQL